MPTNNNPNIAQANASSAATTDLSQHNFEPRESTVSHHESGYIKAYNQPAAGWGALHGVTENLNRQHVLARGSITLLDMNQPHGFDCPGCAWPDGNKKTVNFCENGAKAVAFEATSKTVTPEFFAQHTVTWLREQSDYYLENMGRLTHPMRYNPNTDKYEPITWDDAFALIGEQLNSLDSPDEAAFYTSGRTSNEAAFLYQLFVRRFGTNNFPDCSNMCHEPTSVGLKDSIGLGKATVKMEDFELTDTVFSFGHNPGTNHPRMLGTLAEVSRRGGTIVAINPLKERGLERFQDPQSPTQMLTNGSTPISRYYFQPKIGGDYAILLGMLKHLQDWDRDNILNGKPSLFNHNFIDSQTTGFVDLMIGVAHTEWDEIHRHTGLPPENLKFLAELYRDSKMPIFCWGMGITQHQHGTSNVHMLANLMLAMGHIGREGAGLAPIRGHSNVQGNRTMGIWEIPPDKFLDSLDKVFGMQSPRKHGLSAVHTVQAMQEGKVKIFIGLGGNFAVATPDTLLTEVALEKCQLTVQIQTKLNRSHLVHGKEALILPCLGRSEKDEQLHGEQLISVEDSMCYVHLSKGPNTPISPDLLSECDIVARMAEATVGVGEADGEGSGKIDWRWYVESYDRIRDVIGQVLPDFADFNAKVYQPHGFYLQHPANHYDWRTPAGKAQFIFKPLSEVYGYQQVQDMAVPKNHIRYTLMTIRSHDQYNTTLYGLDDRYRGVFGLRRVLFMNSEDIAQAGFAPDDWVNIESCYNDGIKRVVKGFRLVAYNIPRGSLAAYYPETNPLVALGAFDKGAQIPAYKSVPVILHAGQEPQDGDLAEVIDSNFNLYKSVESLANVDEVT